MNDERGNGTAEDARRFYQQNNAAAPVAPGERMVRTAPVRREEAVERVVARDRSDVAPAPVDDNERALGEKPTQGSGGPGILNRSFSGTYEE